MNRKIITDLIQYWVGILKLQQWKIEILWDEPTDPNDNYASMWTARDYYSARLRLAKDWESWTQELAEQNIVHELLHLPMREVDQVSHLIEDHVHKSVDELLFRVHRHATEQVIDHLATVLIQLNKKA